MVNVDTRIYNTNNDFFTFFIFDEFRINTINPKDRRTSLLRVTPSGEAIIGKVQDLVIENRKVAQDGLTLEELQNLNATLKKITKNCQS